MELEHREDHICSCGIGCFEEQAEVVRNQRLNSVVSRHKTHYTEFRRK